MVFIYVLQEDFIAKTFYSSSGQCQPQFNLIFCGRKGHSKILLGTAEFPVPGHWHQGLPRCVILAGVIAWGWVEGQVVSEDGREGSKQAAAALCIDPGRLSAPLPLRSCQWLSGKSLSLDSRSQILFSIEAFASQIHSKSSHQEVFPRR